MEELLDLLPIILQRCDYQEVVCEQAAFAAWNRAVGPPISMNCVPFRLREKRLVVLTVNHLWMKELQQMTSEIIFRINRILGAPLVTTIEYRVDPDRVSRWHSHPKEVEFEALNLVRQELETVAEQISDPLLRETFLNAASRSLARKRSSP